MGKKVAVFGAFFIIVAGVFVVHTLGSSEINYLFSGRAIDKACSDSDGGLNYFEKGDVVDKEDEVHEDYCVAEGENAGKLAEQYCKDGDVVTQFYECENGCSGGRCVGSE